MKKKLSSTITTNVNVRNDSGLTIGDVIDEFERQGHVRTGMTFRIEDVYTVPQYQKDWYDELGAQNMLRYGEDISTM